MRLMSKSAGKCVEHSRGDYYLKTTPGPIAIASAPVGRPKRRATRHLAPLEISRVYGLVIGVIKYVVK